MTNIFSYIRKSANFFVKGQILNVLDFAGHTVCCNYSALSLSNKAARMNV